MNRNDLEVYVARLRNEFAAAYEAQHTAAEHAVTLMRRLALVEALLDTFTDDAAPDPAEERPAPRLEVPTVDRIPTPRNSPEPQQPAPGKRGRRPAVPWDVLAAVWNDAVAAGQSGHKALADLATERGIALSTAKNWPKRLREYGLIAQVGDSPPPRSAAPAPTEPRPKTPPTPKPKAAPAKVEPRFPAPSASIEWDLPARRREAPTDPGSEAPRRAMPRTHIGSGMSIA